MLHHSAWGPRALALALLFALGASSLAADLPLTPLVAGNGDLLQVALRADGGLGVLRQGRIDRVSPTGLSLGGFDAGADQTLVLGDDGATAGIATRRTGAADFAPIAAFELRDPSGARRWSIGPTEDTGFAISSTGAVVGLSLNINTAERGALHFYGSDGRLLAQVAVAGLLGGRFASDGVVFLAQSASLGLLAFDASGVELWRLPEARLFDATPGADAVALVAGDRLEVARDGRVTAQADLSGFLARRIALAPDGLRVAVVSRDELRVYTTGTLDLLWKTTIDGERYAFTSVDLAAGDGWLLAGVARDLGPAVAAEARHPEGEVRAYDAAGALRHQTRLEFPAWNIFTPTVILDHSGAGATITTRRAAYRTMLP